MADNTNGNRPRSSNSGTTIITQGTELKGDISLVGTLHLDGYLEGNLLSTSFVLVGKDGRIRGNIDAQEVYVSGLVEGDIRSQKLEILSGGKVKGEIQSKNVRVECSASLDGKVSI